MYVTHPLVDTLGEGGRPWLESVINSPIASCIVSRSLLSRLGTRTTGRTGLKLNIQKTKIMSSSPITSWQIDGETVATMADFIFFGLQNQCRW